MTCGDAGDFSLCFKCFGHRSAAHNAKHEFEELGSLYIGHSSSSPDLSVGEDQSDHGDDSDDAPQGNAAASSRAGSPSSEDSGFDNDSDDSDGED